MTAIIIKENDVKQNKLTRRRFTDGSEVRVISPGDNKHQNHHRQRHRDT